MPLQRVFIVLHKNQPEVLNNKKIDYKFYLQNVIFELNAIPHFNIFCTFPSSLQAAHYFKTVDYLKVYFIHTFNYVRKHVLGCCREGSWHLHQGRSMTISLTPSYIRYIHHPPNIKTKDI